MGDNVVNGAYSTHVARLIILRGVLKSYQQLKPARSTVSSLAHQARRTLCSQHGRSLEPLGQKSRLSIKPSRISGPGCLTNGGLPRNRLMSVKHLIYGVISASLLDSCDFLSNRAERYADRMAMAAL
jgi:hypothetical protein